MYRSSNIAALYRQYRPRYPKSVLREIVDYALEENPAAEFDLAVDVGCGSGQLTNLLAKKYTNVIGVDDSESQIREARKEASPNAFYHVSRAENLPFGNNSVDLVTTAQSLFWFKEEDFFNEVRRILKPKGTLAVIFYGKAELELPGQGDEENLISEKLTKISYGMYEFMKEKGYLKPHTEKLLQHSLYSFDIPFENRKRITNLSMEKYTTVSDFVKFFASLYFVETYIKENPDDVELLNRLEKEILAIMGHGKESGDEVNVIVRFPLLALLTTLN